MVRFILSQSPSFAMVHNEGLPRVSFCMRVWFTMIPCMNSAQMQTLQVACLQFIVYIPSLSQITQKKIYVTSNPDSYLDRALITCS